MKVLIAESDAGALQRMQNVRVDVCDRTMLRPIPFSTIKSCNSELCRIVLSEEALNLRTI